MTSRCGRPLAGDRNRELDPFTGMERAKGLRRLAEGILLVRIHDDDVDGAGLRVELALVHRREPDPPPTPPARAPTVEGLRPLDAHDDVW